MKEACKFYGFVFHKTEFLRVSGYEYSTLARNKGTRKKWPLAGTRSGENVRC